METVAVNLSDFRLANLLKVYGNNEVQCIPGYFCLEPKEGKRFVFFKASLTPGENYQTISTTVVQSAETVDSRFIDFETKNSSYRLEIVTSSK